MSQDANNQAKQKITLETEMQILEKCMEDMKAVYKLNQEKLGFNYDVLNERQTVFNKQKKGLKSKFNKDSQILRNEVKAFGIQQTEAKNKNTLYTKEYKFFTNEFIKLQKRFERFEKADDRRIKEIWSMNDQEARNLVEKIMHADKVIHLQQLSIKWEPPRDQFFAFLSESNAVAGDSSFKGADSATQGNSIMNQNTSIMDSQGGNGQAQSKSELVDDQSVATKNENTTREKYERMKQVFRFLIDKAPFLIDDKATERCVGVDGKEQLKIKIDSVRKTIGIEDMADVELLVDVLYKFQDDHEKRLEKERKDMEEEENLENAEGGNPEANPNPLGNQKTSNEATLNGAAEGQASREEEEIDENLLRLDTELLTAALKEFHQAREDRDVNKVEMNAKKQKKSKDKSADKAKDASLLKKKDRLYWASMTKILTDQKLSVWKALD